MKNQINNVMLQRLQLQSTQRELSQKFGINNYSPQYFSSGEFRIIFSLWPEEKRKNFYKLLGGQVYRKEIKEVLNLL